MALHSLIGAGFLAATFLVKPFLPETEEEDRDAVCNVTRTGNDKSDNVTTIRFGEKEEDQILGVSKIAWPFLITGAWCIVFSSGYAILGKSPIYTVLLM